MLIQLLSLTLLAHTPWIKGTILSLEISPTTTPNANEHCIKHGEQVFYQGEVLSSEASHFKIINNEYAKDAFHVFFQGEIVAGMVPEGFTVISAYYRKDKNQAYFFNTPIAKSDPNTFEVFNDTISRDQNNLYYNGNIVENKKVSQVSRSYANELKKLWKYRALHLDAKTVILVDSDEVEDITSSFYTYNNEVYSWDEKLAGVAPNDVVVLNRGDNAFVRINDQVFYYDTVIMGADPDTFTIISERFSKDANHVYWSEHSLADTEPSTFKNEDNLYADENEAGDYILKIAEF